MSIEPHILQQVTLNSGQNSALTLCNKFRVPHALYIRFSNTRCPLQVNLFARRFKWLGSSPVTALTRRVQAEETIASPVKSVRSTTRKFTSRHTKFSVTPFGLCRRFRRRQQVLLTHTHTHTHTHIYKPTGRHSRHLLLYTFFTL